MNILRVINFGLGYLFLVRFFGFGIDPPNNMILNFAFIYFCEFRLRLVLEVEALSDVGREELE